MIPIVLSLLLVVTPHWALTQQPGRAPSAVSSAPVQLPPQRSSSPAFDSVVAAVTRIGFAVAEVKSGLHLYRRAAFNDPDGSLLQGVTRLRNSCRELALVVERDQGKLCATCLPSQPQQTLDRYRAYMPTLARTGRECSSRLQRLSSATPADSAPARLRRQVLPISNLVMQSLVPYEDRLQQVRIAFGWERPPTQASPTR